MPTFSECGLDVELVLEAVVIGGNIDAIGKNGKKKRLRVPRLQESLIRLAEGNQVIDHDILADKFKRQWSSVKKRNRGKFILEQKRDFFRNFAKLVCRINDSLCAGYRDTPSRTTMLSQTGGRFFGLAYNYQAFRIEVIVFDDLESYLEHIQISNNGNSASESNTKSKLLSQPDPLSRIDECDEESAGGREGEGVTLCERNGEGRDDQNPKESIPSGLLSSSEEVAERPAQPEVCSATEELADEDDFTTLTEFEEDEVTGEWTFVLDDHKVGVERHAGYIKIDGRPFRADFVVDLTQPEEISGLVLQGIRDFIRVVENQV